MFAACRLGVLGCQLQGLTGFPQAFRAVGAVVIRKYPPELKPLTAKTGDSADQEADRAGLALIWYHLRVSKAGGIVDGYMRLFVATTR